VAEEVVGDPGRHAVGVFAEDGRHGSACGAAQSLVISGGDPVDDLGMVHDVRFEEDHRAFVDSGGEEIAEPEVGFAGGFAGRFGTVAERGQARGLGHASGHRGTEGDFRFRDALHDADEGFEALVVEGQFTGQEAAMGNEVQVIGGGEGRRRGISPAVGIEMEADDEVGTKFGVYPMPAGADFGGAVEEPLGFTDDLCFGGCVACVGEALACRGDEFSGPQGSERVGGFAQEKDGRAQVFEARFEKLGGGEGEVAFPDWWRRSMLE